MLKIIKEKIEENICQEIDWNDYDFGKNFYNNVQRNDETTELETDFIINKLRLKNNSSILDLGCGDGRNCFELSQKGYKVTGVDLNLYAIEQGQKKISEQNIDNVELIHKNILDIDYVEKFNSVIMIFNHFSNFKLFDAQKILKKIEKSLIKDGKLLIEISSESFLESLDGTQEWQFSDNWLSGEYEQLILIENEYNNKDKLHLRKDHCIELNGLNYKGYVQKSYSYTPEKIHDILKFANLKLIQIYGNWDGKPFEITDDYMIITAQK
jgi:ubiquinone/menaquinone biosynthesis C-methylase UbiE